MKGAVGISATEHFEAFRCETLPSVAFCCAAWWRTTLRGAHPSQIHEGARPSRLPDRNAARHRRGLDGRSAIVTENAVSDGDQPF